MILSAKELKNYVKLSKGCRFANEGLEINKSGYIKLELGKGTVEIKIKKKNGNGLTKISSDIEQLNVKIVSVLSESFHINIGDSGMLLIDRQKNSNGSIEIISISKVKDMKWRTILRNAEYKGVSASQERLFASENAYIKAEFINSITTNPINSAYIKNNNTTVIFKNSCEITDLKISSKDKKEKKQFLPHFNTNNIKKSIVKELKKPENNKTKNNDIVFDSTTSTASWNHISVNKLNDKKSKTEMSRNGIMLKFRDEITIPINILSTDYNYSIVIDAKNIIGNGKIEIGILPLNNYEIIKLSKTDRIYKKIFKIEQPASVYSLTVRRPNSAVGDVFIKSIKFIKEKDTVDINFNNIKTNRKLIIESYNDSSIYNTSKAHARFKNNQYVNECDLITDIKSTICIGSFSAANWFNKVSCMLPNITTAQSVAEGNPILFTDINSADSAKKIYIEEFNKNNKLNDNNIRLLETAEKIYSPSLENIEFINKKFGKKAYLANKSWPIIKPNKLPHIKESFLLLLYRHDDKILKEFISKYDSSKLPKIVLTEARGSFPGFIYPVNEYLEYDHLFWLILNSECIIDLSNNNYYSAALDLALNIGALCITTNEFFLYRENCLKFQDINNLKNQISNYEKNINLNNHNYIFKNTLFNIL